MKIYSIRLSDGYYKANNINWLISFKSNSPERSMPTQNQDVVQIKNEVKASAGENFSGKTAVKHSSLLDKVKDFFKPELEYDDYNLILTRSLV